MTRKTQAKANYNIVSTVGKIGYKIQWNKGGQMPKQLSGTYTSHNAAKLAIDDYETKLRPQNKRTTNGQKAETGTEELR